MKLTLDVENTVIKRNGKLHLDPFEPENTLVMVGMLDDLGIEDLVTFDHAEQQPTTEGRAIVQLKLDEASLLIMHNAAHDLVWLWESGFTYEGEIFDTMLGEYILQRGQKEPLSLEACAERYELDTKKQDTLKAWLNAGNTVRDMNHKELSDYLSADLHATQELYNHIDTKLRVYEEHMPLQDTVKLTNQLAVHLAHIYQRGFAVDLDALESVRQEYETERDQLAIKLEEQVRNLMGDRPINLGSTEQLSWVIYSRKPKDKKFWAELFEERMDDQEYKYRYVTAVMCCINRKPNSAVRVMVQAKCVRQRKMEHHLHVLISVLSVMLLDLPMLTQLAVAGLKFFPPTAKWVSHSGFSTSKDSLVFLEGIARSKGMTEAETFLQSVRRLSAVETYLSSFIDGIATHTKQDGKLHVRLLQHRTGTGRLSGADPTCRTCHVVVRFQ